MDDRGVERGITVLDQAVNSEAWASTPVQDREQLEFASIYAEAGEIALKAGQGCDRRKGVTGTLLLQYLERRLDNVVYRIGFATSRNQARQLVRHGHVQVNGRKVNVPSFLCSKDDEVGIREKSRKNPFILSSVESMAGRGVPSWLKLEGDNLKGQVLELPSREDIQAPIEESLIVELYSK